jgi:probable sporulation protein (polysaccharide deacetylase family)
LDDLGAQPIYKGNPNKRMVALMINVAWGNEFIGPMLDILDRENVKATFFFDGSWLSKNVDTAKGIQQRGHELSNHAYSHKNMSTLGRQESINEIDKTQKLLKEQLGVDNPLFAPPSGDFNQQTVQIAHEMGLKTILWTLDTVDWMKPSSESIVRKVAARVEPGTMILMHPTESSSGALEGMIRVIKEKDLALGTVSQVISSNRVPSPNVSLEGNP